MLTGLLWALAATGVFGVAAVLQGVATERADTGGVLDRGLFARLARQPLFLAALALNLLGFGFHVAALRTLPLFLVQAVIAGSVAVTAVLSVRVFHTPLGRSQWTAVGLVVLGLALLGPTATSEPVTPGGGSEALALLVAVAAVAGGAAVARTVRGPAGAVLLGLLAGSGFGVVAVAARLLPDVGTALLTSPMVLVMSLAGATAFLLYSAAMHRGTVTTATAAMVVTQTVLPAAAGLLLGDRVQAGLVPLAAVGFALALLGAVGLGRFEHVAVTGPAR